MAKKEIKTDYILPDAAMQQLAGDEAQQFSSLQVLKDFIANPDLPIEDGNPLAGGILPCIMAFDKPLHLTSFQLVAKVRWLLTRALGKKKIKIGHAGTLDPLATGVMVICTGRATKLIEQMQAGVKEYYATVQLGATTPSFDLEHPIDQTFPTEHITEEMVREALKTFEGDIMQVPPAFSACKVEGKRAYDMARSGKEVQLKAKPLRIEQIELTECHLERNEITIRVVCSKGTYIRALARDIGIALNSGAHLTALRRTRVGIFNIDRCFTLNDFEDALKS
jgi:tRNA pseudouridine synthase B